MRSKDELLHLARNGAGFDFNASTYSTADLVHIVQNVSNGTITMRGMGSRSTDDLVQIARNGKGNVIFVD